MKKHILLTGKPGVGKTTVIKKIVPLLGVDAGGFYTEEIRVMDRRMGFRIVTLDGKDGILAHVDCNSNYKVGKYRVDLDSFESVAIPTLEKAIKDKAIIVIDEIGKMELFSMKFKELVSNILDGEKSLLSVIKENGDVFTENIKKRGDVTMITVNYENREGLLEKILGLLKGIGKS
ncbi:MAG: AAA family ATPase [Planctomycetes bacterium GWF2_39_10]|nr:MAG: AAA family ATPase [Planctomycetes bacterium GWC2_39_26]OHB47206.1 MAG: AAA family ATPase [Planctomycetes bacterium GWF2_39_10]OHB99596.1 MAG: AAA family ATPase [Planctomycetes bacterium RIFCSPLOWO2_12_FULL_39_13]